MQVTQGAAGRSFEVWLLECRGSSLWIPDFHDPVAETTHAARAGSQPVRYVPDASESQTYIYHCLLPTCFRKGHSLLHPFLCWSLSCSHVTLRQFSSVLKRQRPRSAFQGNRNSLRLAQVRGHCRSHFSISAMWVVGTNSGHQAWQEALPTEPSGQPKPGHDLFSLLLWLQEQRAAWSRRPVYSEFCTRDRKWCPW